jgi:hypothetical protein
MDNELTLEILRDIRDGVRATNERLDVTNQRLDVTNERLDGTNQRLDVTNERLGAVEHTVRDLAEQMLMTTRYIKNSTRRHDDAIADLDERVTALETKKP